MAPMILVAAKVIANKITEIRAVPRIPVKTAVNVPLVYLQDFLPWQQQVVASNTAKYPIAIPNATHKNAGVTVITALICKKAAITPIIALAITAKLTQLGLFSQQKIDIFFHLLVSFYENEIEKVSKNESLIIYLILIIFAFDFRKGI